MVNLAKSQKSIPVVLTLMGTLWRINAMNMGVQIPLYVSSYSSCGYIPRSGTAGGLIILTVPHIY